MNSLMSMLFHAETGSLWLLTNLFRVTAVSLSMAVGGFVLLLFWSADVTRSLLEGLVERGSAGHAQGIKGSR